MVIYRAINPVTFVNRTPESQFVAHNLGTDINKLPTNTNDADWILDENQFGVCYLSTIMKYTNGKLFFILINGKVCGDSFLSCIFVVCFVYLYCNLYARKLVEQNLS